MESPIMDVPDVARYLRVHRSTIYRMLKHHRLPAFKVGRDWKFDIHAIEAWVQDRVQRTNGSSDTIQRH